SSSQYFEQYLARVQNMKTPPRAARDVHEAYFSYAENLRRQNRLAEAQPYYQQTMNLIRERQLHTPRALSLEAQSAAWAGHPDASDTIFEYAFRRFPDNAVIKADKAALKIEQKHYEEARSLLASLDNAHASDPNQLGVPLVTAEDAGSATPPLVMDNGRQMVVHTAPETITPRYWLAHVRSHPDVSYVTEGYDTVLIVTKAGHTFNVSQPNQTGWLAKTETLPVLDIRSEPAQLKLRKELLQARMMLAPQPNE
ncbi:MAG: tetratricopeptide repeat protein, partial [Rickettsiales bacterium]